MNLREIIYAARGDNRSMSQFAKELKMSPAKLYRIAEGDIRRPLPDEDLHNIVRCSAPDSGITYEELRKEVEAALKEKSDEKYSQEDAVLGPAREIHARDAVARHFFNSHLRFNNMETSHHRNYDFAIALEMVDGLKRLYFDVIGLWKPIQAIYERIGRLVCHGIERDEWYYLVVMSPYISNDTDVPYRTLIYNEFAETDIMANISILVIQELADNSYHFDEICLNRDEQFYAFTG